MGFYFSKEISSNSFVNLENAFILDYIPSASGDAVKVYLYGLYLCSNNKEIDIQTIATNLSITEKAVSDSLNYWEEFGLISVITKAPLTVEFLPVRSTSFGKVRKYKAEKYTDFSKGLQALLPSRMISTSEFTEYFGIMETYSIKPEAMLLIVKYCADKKGENISYKYVAKVAKDFGNRHVNTVEEVEKELSSYILKTGAIEKILKAMKLNRQPDIDDQNLLKKWTHELNFDTENIIFAASKLKKGSMEKLDNFLMELYSIKSFSEKEIAEYVDKKQSAFDLAVKVNKALSIYIEVVETEVDTYINKWLSYGFTEDTLLLIASNLFRSGKNTLKDMDELIEGMRKSGFIDLTSVSDYFTSQKETEDFIKQMLITAGINRRPTPWDFENINIWKSWNFTESMILEASKLASGKSSPLAYMNGILSNWKNKGIFTLDKIELEENKTDILSTENYNKEYERRRGIAISKSQRNIENAMEIQGFSKAYERYYSIEKDLAFAEMSSNFEALKNLENEKQNLTNNISEMLKTIGLDIDDLSPKFACDKCHDTGYIGTHRCDCIDKIIK